MTIEIIQFLTSSTDLFYSSPKRPSSYRQKMFCHQVNVFYRVFTYEILKATDTPLKGKPLTPIEAKNIFESKERGKNLYPIERVVH